MVAEQLHVEIEQTRILTILRHIENSGIVRDIQQYTAIAIFRHTEGHLDILRHILALLRHMES